jgi:hypothetical protein
MKPEVKHWSHEVEYAAIAVVTLILLSILVFPLFIALLPIALITGCSVVWDLDHLRKKT